MTDATRFRERIVCVTLSVLVWNLPNTTEFSICLYHRSNTFTAMPILGHFFTKKMANAIPLFGFFLSQLRFFDSFALARFMAWNVSFQLFLPFRLRANNRRSNLTPVASQSNRNTWWCQTKFFWSLQKTTPLKLNQSVRFDTQLLF